MKVATVPEFLAKQLLKHFGFPFHVAPGEAEAECALLQREGVVDAVVSEDVDTLMFGSGMTLRNWASESSGKTPTHVDVYTAEKTGRETGLEREGMVLVALMSGGDYLPEGIPGVGVKVACDAARAGFGRELCELVGKYKGNRARLGEVVGEWKERLQFEIRTNTSKFFSRKNTGLTIPEDFPNLEVLGCYTHPCVSSPAKLDKLRESLKWDAPIDFPALRTFAADAFDWRCKGGANKFIKNLAPAMLAKELRLRSSSHDDGDFDEQERGERELVHAIHGKRNHASVDGECEYRISFTPLNLVPIDLDVEEEDDEFIPAGGVEVEDTSDAESELPANTLQAQADETDIPATPSKKRTFKPYDPSQPEKLWVLRTFLRVGCPLLVEDYEAPNKDPREFLKARRKARAVGKGDGNLHATKSRKKKERDMPRDALLQYGKVSKAGRVSRGKENGGEDDGVLEGLVGGFKLPSTQIPAELLRKKNDDVLSTVSASQQQRIEVLDLATEALPRPAPPSIANPTRPFAAFAAPASTKLKQARKPQKDTDIQRTPRRNTKKRPSTDMSSPAMSQRTIMSYYSPSPQKSKPLSASALPVTPNPAQQEEVINLISSPPRQPAALLPRPQTPTPPNTRFQFLRSSPQETVGTPLLTCMRPEFSPGKLPDTVTKRRRKKGGLKRWGTAPASCAGLVGDEDEDYEEDGGEGDGMVTSREGAVRDALQGQGRAWRREAVDLVTSSPEHGEVLGGFGGSVVGIWEMGDGGTDVDVDVDVLMPHNAAPDTIAVSSSPPPSPNTKTHIGKKVQDWPPDSRTNRTANLNPHTNPPNPPIPPTPLPTPPAYNSQEEEEEEEEEVLPPPITLPPKPLTTTKEPRRSPHHSTDPSQPSRRSPRQHQAEAGKKRIQLRESLEGWWREVEGAEVVDLSGGRGEAVGRTGPGRNGGADGGGWRRSGVEVLDLTGG